jgi:predicted nucleic acid-binding protein
MLFDTEFLICFAGGKGSVRKSRAKAFLDAHDVPLYISRVCWMEFAAGCETRATLDKDLGIFTVLEMDESVAWQTSRTSRQLKGQGLHIGDNDVWIAATALDYAVPLVSNNKAHFGRVPGLKLLAY